MSLTPREYMAIRKQWDLSKEYEAALHGHRVKQRAGAVPGLPVSHGQQNGHVERAVKTGGRVATQSPEDQKAVFASMLEAAFAPRQQVYFEHPDGRKMTAQEMEAVNGHS